MLIYRSFVLSFLLYSCSGEIKNSQVRIEVENGTSTDSLNIAQSKLLELESACIGFWVGEFNSGLTIEEEELLVEQGGQFSTTNKINISIDSISGSKVFGHSVVAGNDRPFVAKITAKIMEKQKLNACTMVAKEPGNHPNDGEFRFTLFPQAGQLTGTWEAFKKVGIYKRKYELKRTNFVYDSLLQLEHNGQFINWQKSRKVQTKIGEDGQEEDEYYERDQFSTSTDKIFEINASAAVLSKKIVENLKKADLQIIRNTIYARHGYSFKNTMLRNYFDLQDWYVPLHADITKNLTALEKENIALLLRYEKNAAEYYDFFGR